MTTTSDQSPKAAEAARDRGNAIEEKERALKEGGGKSGGDTKTKGAGGTTGADKGAGGTAGSDIVNAAGDATGGATNVKAPGGSSK